MVRIELQPTEAEVLKMVLESYLSDLRMEIADTDSMDFRQGLKAKKQFLLSVIEQLEHVATLLGGELGQAPIVEDDQIGLGKAGHELGKAPVTMGQTQVLEQPR